MNFTIDISHWYSVNKRILPWRESKDPYKVWLSEIILQQTKVEQGMPYFHAFVSKYPKVSDLANASEEEVLHLWQGLGYYSRARNLHFTAKKITEDYDGKFPNTYKELLKLKGVGDYTAAAISSICFEESQAVLDGNVFRVLSRYFGIDIPIDSTEGKKFFRSKAQELLPNENIGDYNQALMDFGSQQCKPKKPNCSDCLLSKDCVAFQIGSQTNLPVKKGKTKVKNTVFNYLIFDCPDKKTAIRKRDSGIWKNLYEFPFIESSKDLRQQDVENYIKENYSFDFEVDSLSDFTVLHKLSHRHIRAVFYRVFIHENIDDLVLWKDLKDYPMPVLLNNFVAEYTNQ